MIAEINKNGRVSVVEDEKQKAIQSIEDGRLELAIDQLVEALKIREGIAIAESPESARLRKRIQDRGDE